MGPADIAARYREYASKCVALAHTMADAAEKLALIDMAQCWIDLAEQAAKNEHLAVVYETPDPAQPA